MMTVVGRHLTSDHSIAAITRSLPIAWPVLSISSLQLVSSKTKQLRTIRTNPHKYWCFVDLRT